MRTLLNYTDMTTQLHRINSIGIEDSPENPGEWYFFNSESKAQNLIYNKFLNCEETAKFVSKYVESHTEIKYQEKPC